MATITPRLFSQDATADVDEEQLLKLFWNRAELKKELAALEREMRELEERTQQKDALLLRIQQRLTQLETLLSDPESADTAVTYYQLRGVWNFCNQQLVAIASEQVRCRRDRAYQQFAADQESARQKALARIDQDQAGIMMEVDSVAAGIRALRARRHSQGGILGLFRRRPITRELGVLRDKRRVLNQKLNALAAERCQVFEAPLDDFNGVDLAAKRSINLLLIAYAQEFYLVYSDSNIAKLSREASMSHVGDVQYGGRRAGREIRNALNGLLCIARNDEDMPVRAGRRARYLRDQVEYRNEKDLVPMAASLGTIPLLDEQGQCFNHININILADEYWNLFGALLS